ncbi:MAG: site-specific integrase [Eubacteriales bacterium]
MSAYKDEKTGKWYVFFYYRDHTGKNKGKTKRGFPTKREALEWEREFKQTQSENLEMSFSSFVEVYSEYIRPRIKHNTWLSKKNVIDSKLIPYFGDKAMNSITANEITKWQSSLMNHQDENGKPFSPVYLRTIHSQLASIFNYAERFHDLKGNPTKKAGGMGKKKGREMEFWTKEEYLLFADEMRDKPLSFYVFEVLYWCGLRVGELLALTPKDVDFEKKTITINKSYQRLEGKDYITTPKTEKSNRIISISDFLAEELQEYIQRLYEIEEDDRLFQVTSHYLTHEMERGCKASGVKKIRLHDLRHSAISLLIELGFTPLAIASRMGHESIDITLNYAHLYPSKQIEMAEKLNIERGDE